MTQPETSDTSLVLTERIDAAPDVVFDFFVDPVKILRWMGTDVEIDPRPGGTFWLNVTGQDIASGAYLAVEPPHRVVFTWGWEGSTDVPPGSSTVTITLTAEGDKTLVELRHNGLPGGDDAHGRGWAHFIARLVTVSEGRDPGPDEYLAVD